MFRFVWVFIALAPLVAEERVDLAAINQIKNEAFENSKVMDHLSFMTDMYGCGKSLGTLTVNGAIAQGHRGIVGVKQAAAAPYDSNGFKTKNYVYDTRLKSRTPPNFLDPVNAAWHVVRQVEQTPAAYDCTKTPKPAGCP